LVSHGCPVLVDLDTSFEVEPQQYGTLDDLVLKLVAHRPPTCLPTHFWSGELDPMWFRRCGTDVSTFLSNIQEARKASGTGKQNELVLLSLRQVSGGGKSSLLIQAGQNEWILRMVLCHPSPLTSNLVRLLHHEREKVWKPRGAPSWEERLSFHQASRRILELFLLSGVSVVKQFLEHDSISNLRPEKQKKLFAEFMTAVPAQELVGQHFWDRSIWRKKPDEPIQGQDWSEFRVQMLTFAKNLPLVIAVDEIFNLTPDTSDPFRTVGSGNFFHHDYTIRPQGSHTRGSHKDHPLPTAAENRPSSWFHFPQNLKDKVKSVLININLLYEDY
jgi:hypothetical protein